MTHPLRALALFVLAILVGLLATGCGTQPNLLQQQFTTLCPIVTADLETLSTSPLLPATAQAQAKAAHDFNVVICTAGATVNLADLQQFANTALPALSSIIGAIPGFPAGTGIALALNTFGPLALQLVETAVAVAHPASAPVAASAPTPASAP